MQSHALPLAEPERAGLLPDRVRDADAAEVVRERGAPQEVTESAGRPMRHAAASASSATPVECSRSQGDLSPVIAAIVRERRVDPVAREPDQRRRLALEPDLPHPRLVELGEHLVEVPRGELGEPRLVGAARSPLDDRACLSPPGGQEERDVPRHVQEAHRQRDLVAGHVRESPPVPAREDVLERLLDARPQAEPAREPLRHLAHRRERLAGPRAGALDGILDHLRRGPPGDARARR